MIGKMQYATRRVQVESAAERVLYYLVVSRRAYT